MKKWLFWLGMWLALAPAGWSQGLFTFKRTEDVIYGRKFGTALTLDVIQPAKPNGLGVIWVISSAWVSSHEAISPHGYQPLLDRGYTIFAVVPGSSPKFFAPEMVEDVHRAVRFVRHNAAKYGIDPARLGITGTSAGGHLALLIATRGGPGKTNATDVVDRESSAVQAAACFYPVTDWAEFTHVDKRDEKALQMARELSSVNYLTDKTPPILIIHGDADQRVPIQQSQAFAKRAQEVGATMKLIVRPGLGHGWPKLGEDQSLFADWFDQYLRGKTPVEK